LNDEHRAALAVMLESGPIPAVHGVVRWRVIDLCQRLGEEYEVTVAKLELRAMGYRKLSARPRHHEQAAGAIETFKNWPATVAAIAQERGLDRSTIEVWFADEARVGQKNKIARRWAKRGSRPSAPSDQRTASTYIFGAICPKRGKAVGLILPLCNTAMMNLHLAAIPPTSPRAVMRSCWPIKLDGTSRKRSSCLRTSPSSCCHRSAPS
jgi:putative transposase